MSPPLAFERLVHAMATLAVVAVLMVVVTAVGFLAFTPEGQLPNLPWLSASISVLAVGLPTLWAFYWPKGWAPASFPRYGPPRAWVILGVGLLSLPCYLLFASLQFIISQALVSMHVVQALHGTGLEPLVAQGFGPTLWLLVAIALLPAWSEELLFRGLVQRAWVGMWGPWVGLLGTSVLFASFHLEPAGFLPRVLMGLWFGLLAWRLGGLGMATWAHALNNAWGVALANHPDWLMSHPYLVVACAMLALALGGVALWWEAELQDTKSQMGPREAGHHRLVSVRPPEEG